MLINRKFKTLVVIALIGIALVSTISAFNSTNPSSADLSWPPRPDFWHLEGEKVISPSYRSPIDECFDVSISELAQCRNESQEN